MKTIKQVVAEIKAAGLRLDSRESTWAESKWWFAWGNVSPGDAMRLVARVCKVAGRPVRYSRQWQAMDGFSGVFVSFPKNPKAARMIAAGIDPTDLEMEP